jgi:hypothetical protein
MLAYMTGPQSISNRLIDAKQAGELLSVPHTWLLEQARRDAVPHIRLGRYVRFDPDQLLAWARRRARGPVVEGDPE